MNTISINDIQQRGFAVLSESLKMGPIQIVEPNQPIYVILTKIEYTRLKNHAIQQTSVLDWFARAGNRSREDIDATLKAEREAWENK